MKLFKYIAVFFVVMMCVWNVSVNAADTGFDILFEENFDYQDYKMNGRQSKTDIFVNKNQTPVWSIRQNAQTMFLNVEESNRTGYGDALKISTADKEGSVFFANSGSGTYIKMVTDRAVVVEGDFLLNKDSLPSYDSYVMWQLMTMVNSEYVIPFVMRRYGDELHISRSINTTAQVLYKTKFPDGEWIKLRVIFDYINGRWYCEHIDKDGTSTCFLKSATIPECFISSGIRSVRTTYNVTANSEGTEAAIFADNIRCYSIDGVQGFENTVQASKKYSDMMNFNSFFKESLNNKIVLNVSCRNVLVGGVRKQFNEDKYNLYPEEYNGNVFVPFKELLNLLDVLVEEKNDGLNFTVKGSEYTIKGESEKYYIGTSEYQLCHKSIKNGDSIMLSAEDIAVIVGKVVSFYDDGLVVFSDKAEDLYITETDALRSHLIYHNPTESDYMNGFNSRGTSHPRVIVPDSGIFTRIRESILKDASISEKYNILLSEADSVIKGKHYNYEIVPLSQIHVLRNFRYRAELLGLAYHVSGDEKYAKFLYDETKLAAKVSTDWRTVGYLNAGTLLMGLGVAYDRLYYYLDMDERKALRDEIIERHIMPGLEAQRGTLLSPSSNWSDVKSTVGWVTWNTNWNIICNSGMMTMACAMIDDEPELSVEILTRCYKSLKYYTPSFYPDGASLESLGYLNVILSDFARLLSTLQTTFGTTYGIADVPGLSNIPYVIEYLTGPCGINNFGDAAENKSLQSAEVLIFSDMMKDLSLGVLREKCIEEGSVKTEPADLIWHTTGGKVELSEDKYFRVGETGSMRSTWDNDAMYLSFHAGDNGITHSHMDTGAFVLDALGERWAVDLGSDRLSYSMEADSGITSRWDLYMLRSEGHNTLTINPDETPGQTLDAVSRVVDFESIKSGSYAIVDMTGAYNTHADKAMRGYMLHDDRSVVTVRDEVELKEKGDIYWFMHTKADITITNNGKGAYLEQNGKRLYVKLSSNQNVIFEVMEAKPFETSPKLNYQASTEGIKKLAVVLKDAKKLELSISFSAEAEKLTECYDGRISDWSAGNIFDVDFKDYDEFTVMRSTKGGFITPSGKLYTYSGGDFTASVKHNIGKNEKRAALEINSSSSSGADGFWMWENESFKGKKDKIISVEQSYYIPSESDFAQNGNSWLCHDNRFGENLDAQWYAYAFRNGNITNRAGNQIYEKIPLDEWFTVRVLYFINEGSYSIILEKEDGSRHIILSNKLITNQVMLDAMKGFGYNKSRTQMFFDGGKMNIFLGKFTVKSLASYADAVFSTDKSSIEVMLSDREEKYCGEYALYSAVYAGERLVKVELLSELEAGEALAVESFALPESDAQNEKESVGVFLWDKGGLKPVFNANFVLQ